MADNSIQFGNCDFNKDISAGQKQLETEELKKIWYLFEEIGGGNIDVTDGINGEEAKQLFETIGGTDGKLTDKELMDICSGLKGDVTLEDVNAFKGFLSFLAESFAVATAAEETAPVAETKETEQTGEVANDTPEETQGETRTATVQKWGTGEDDCLWRIMKKAYPDVAPGSSDWKKLEEMIMNANPKIYGDENGNGGRKRIIDGTRHNAVLYTGDVITLPPFTPSASTDAQGDKPAAATQPAEPEKPAQPETPATTETTKKPPVPPKDPFMEVYIDDDDDQDRDYEPTPAELYMAEFLSNRFANSRNNDKIIEMLSNPDLSFQQKMELLEKAKQMNPIFGIGQDGLTESELCSSLKKLFNSAKSSDGSSAQDKLKLIQEYLKYSGSPQLKAQYSSVRSSLIGIYSDNKANISPEEFCKAMGFENDPVTSFTNALVDLKDSTNITKFLNLQYADANKTPVANAKQLEDNYLDRGGFLIFGRKSDSELVAKILTDFKNQSTAKMKMQPSDVMYLLMTLFKNNMTNLKAGCTDEQLKQIFTIMNMARAQ